MRLTLSFILTLFYVGVHCQEFGSSGITNSLYNLDNQVTLVKSLFNTVKVTFKNKGKKLISPSHSNSYIYFREDLIGVLVAPAEFVKSQNLLTEVKVLNNKKNGEKLLFFSREKHLISVNYESNKIIWSYSTDTVEYEWTFENLSLADEAEIFDVIERFQLGNAPLPNVSSNSQNLIGLTEQQVLLRCSENYKKPVLIEERIGNFTDRDDLVLLFVSIEDDEIYNVVIFNQHQICKYILSYYPNGYLKDISKIYNELYGESTAGLTWFERVGNKRYSYTIDLISARKSEKFVIHTKQEK